MLLSSIAPSTFVRQSCLFLFTFSRSLFPLLFPARCFLPFRYFHPSFLSCVQTILFVDMPSQANVRATRSRSLAESEHVQAKRRRDGQDCKVTCRNKVLHNDETEQMNRKKRGKKNSQLQDKERSDNTGIIWKRTTSALPGKKDRPIVL